MAKSKNRFYAVKKGIKPGIYTTWDECSTQVQGFPGAQYKGFSSLNDAEEYLGVSKPKVQEEAIELETRDGLKKVILYTDGSAIGNPGPGGYGVVLIHGKHRKELSGGFRLTTNNRMEIMACIAGLQTLKTRCSVTLYTDSQYVVNSMTKGWAERWQIFGWQKGGQEVPNADLWEQLLDLCDRHEVTFAWVRGHSGNRENERCDQLARRAALQKNLPIDVGYEERLKSRLSK